MYFSFSLDFVVFDSLQHFFYFIIFFCILLQTLKSFLPSMLANSHGHIVSINSVLGLITLAGASDYCASKFGLHGLTNAVVKELRSQGATGVHVSSIHPYQVDNEMFDGCTTRYEYSTTPCCHRTTNNSFTLFSDS